MRPQPVPVALVDDHTLVRHGLAQLIERSGNFKVVLQASNGREYVEAQGIAPPVRIAVVDLNMPVMDGFDTIRWITDHQPDVRSLALTFEASERAILRAIRNGARGFILKDIEPSELELALDHVNTSGYYHTDLVHRSLMGRMDRPPETVLDEEELVEGLTEREREFLRFACDPQEPTYDVIAELMGVTRRTVDGYRESVGSKFGIKSRTGLVLLALKHGLVKP